MAPFGNVSDNRKEKKEIRRRMRRERSGILPERKNSWDSDITKRLMRSRLLPAAECVYCFYSTDEEPDTTKLLELLLLSGRKVACPRVEKGEINFYYINALTDCCPGFRGIYEPLDVCLRADDELSLVILPGLAFSLKGERIGYGGGYYDRFLTREPAHRTAALAYPFQVLESLPAGDGDVKTEYIITPDEMIRAL